MKRAPAILVFGIIVLTAAWAVPQAVFTGLIFDARHLSFVPSASPKILDEDGRELYGSAYVGKEWVEKQGIVGYAKTPEEAGENQRVAGNPLMVKALKVTGPNSRDLVVSNEDARKIRELARHLNFLEHAKVMIVVP